jgi:hypothetical protein
MIETLESGAAAAPPPSRRLLFVAGLLSLTMTACTMRGPDSMRASRIAYSEAVQVSERRELLLNLVRLRYTEAPEFLAISGISTQMSFEAGASIGGAFGEEGGDDLNIISPGASATYSESPTITFVPQRDQDFTRQLLAPVELDSLYLLTREGWGIDRVLLVVAGELNGLSNPSGPEVGAGDAVAFRELVDTLRRLELERLVRVEVERRREALSAPIPAASISAGDLMQAAGEGYRLDYQAEPPGYVLTGEAQHYVMTVADTVWDRPDSRPLVANLGLATGRANYEIDKGSGMDPEGIRVSTRSVLGAMSYLSRAVAVPSAHSDRVARGVATDSLHGVFEVRVAEGPPENAFAAVEHRGYWFYIDDRDLESKRTLGLLNSLVRLSISAGGAQNVPVLTLPVAR